MKCGAGSWKRGWRTVSVTSAPSRSTDLRKFRGRTLRSACHSWCKRRCLAPYARPRRERNVFSAKGWATFQPRNSPARPYREPVARHLPNFQHHAAGRRCGKRWSEVSGTASAARQPSMTGGAVVKLESAVLAGASMEEVADAMGNSPDVVFRHYFKDKGSKLAASGIAKLGAALNLLTSNQASVSPRILEAACIGAGEGQ